MSDWNIFSFGRATRPILVTPLPLGPDFLSYVSALAGIQGVTVLAPKRHSGETCRDALEDKAVFSQLVSIGKQGGLSLSSYAATPQFYALAQALQKRGVRVMFADVPEPEQAWVPEYFGTKLGIRQLGLPMTEGYVCLAPSEAAPVASMLYGKAGGVVVKTNKGHSGFGVDMFRPGELPADPKLREAKLTAWFRKHAYWQKFPIVVEEYKAENPAIAGGFPSAECRVHADGTVEYLYDCGMRMTKDGTFRGMEIHRTIVTPALRRQMKTVSLRIGRHLSIAGYRGYFDVDMLAGRDGAIWVTESNVRRTGGTYVYHLALRLFGKKFMDTTYTISRNSYPLPRALTFAHLRRVLAPVLYDKKTKEGLVLTSEHMMRQQAMGYVIFGRTKRRAAAIEERMEKLLQ